MKDFYYFFGVLFSSITLSIIFGFLCSPEKREIVVEKDGHEYLVVTKYGFTISECHSASCNKCYEIFD